ncbi:vitamin K epoxide reductase family protein [Buchananella hordeovulneris]|uniref:vitamin K epoxide reductase family protein n=1 Tax=Buchananella hordeovulneris TaxID=52770 RepID=UPI00163ADF18|nr:vitamin K epoxide reductase family protein [Buchananella hordeovulneris]
MSKPEESGVEEEYRDPAAPTAHQLAGGAGREFSVVLLVAALLIGFASLQLALAELQFYRDPAGHLACDVNPLIGCSTSLTTPQAHLFFGIPNSLLGLAFAGGLLALGLVLVAGGRLPRLLWWGLCLAGGVLLAYIVYFAHQSVTVFGTLCPWCMVIWVASTVLAAHIFARAAQARHLPLGPGLTRALTLNRWLIAVGLLLVLFGTVLALLWDRVMLVL